MMRARRRFVGASTWGSPPSGTATYCDQPAAPSADAGRGCRDHTGSPLRNDGAVPIGTVCEGGGGMTASRDDRMDGKVVLVTGAGSRAEGIGNGRAASILLARAGAKVALLDLNPDWA